MRIVWPINCDHCKHLQPSAKKLQSKQLSHQSKDVKYAYYVHAVLQNGTVVCTVLFS